MREIKFRAWDLGAESMVDWESIKLHFSEHIDHEMVVVMQYTGLKDKNGKEIYEGDIIFHEKFEEHSEISYFEKGMCFIGLPVEKEVREDYLKGHVHYLDLTCENLQISKCKVVGNIYETPELLEKK